MTKSTGKDSFSVWASQEKLLFAESQSSQHERDVIKPFHMCPKTWFESIKMHQRRHTHTQNKDIISTHSKKINPLTLFVHCNNGRKSEA